MADFVQAGRLSIRFTYILLMWQWLSLEPLPTMSLTAAVSLVANLSLSALGCCRGGQTSSRGYWRRGDQLLMSRLVAGFAVIAKNEYSCSRMYTNLRFMSDLDCSVLLQGHTV